LNNLQPSSQGVEIIAPVTAEEMTDRDYRLAEPVITRKRVNPPHTQDGQYRHVLRWLSSACLTAATGMQGPVVHGKPRPNLLLLTGTWQIQPDLLLPIGHH